MVSRGQWASYGHRVQWESDRENNFKIFVDLKSFFEKEIN